MSKKWTIQTRIITISLILTAILVIALGVIFFMEIRKSIIDGYVEKARSVVLASESVSELMEKKWEMGIFDVAMLRGFAQNNERDKLLATVPVVTAWRSAMMNADEAGYEFKTPKFQPRNPKNEPGKQEAEVIRMFQQDTAKSEHYFIDADLNAIRYFRPVVLSETCLYCHGDPKNSREYWGNDRGLDPTGAKMEDWEVGFIPGAFEVIQSLDEADSQSNVLLLKVVAIVLGALAVIALLFRLFMNRQVINPIKDAVSELAEANTQVLSASDEISKSATNLADGASNLAGTVEEVNATVEEATAINTQNAGNTSEADKLAKLAFESAQDGSKKLDELTQAMGEISEASNKIAQIIKTIDEIAFQTNLLALNAAVEAARAGEHGLGFAVVADEVKNLAGRSAKAAKETASIIEHALEKISGGSKVTDQTREAFGVILENARKTSGLISEIAASIKEQAEGMRQISTSMGTVDQVTQQNAATSEETAAASEELNAQASQMLESARRVADMVGYTIDSGGPTKEITWAKR